MSQTIDKQFKYTLPNGTGWLITYKLSDAPGFCAEVYLHWFQVQNHESYGYGRCATNINALDDREGVLALLKSAFETVRTSHLILADCVNGLIERYLVSHLPDEFDMVVPISKIESAKRNNYLGTQPIITEKSYAEHIEYETVKCRLERGKPFANRNSANKVIRNIIHIGEGT